MDFLLRTMSEISSLLGAEPLAATSVRMEKARNASLTESVPSAESFRPVKGNVSGPRCHWLLMLTRHTWLTMGSISAATASGSVPKMLACWPKGEAITASAASDTSL